MIWSIWNLQPCACRREAVWSWGMCFTSFSITPKSQLITPWAGEAVGAAGQGYRRNSISSEALDQQRPVLTASLAAVDVRSERSSPQQGELPAELARLPAP